MEGEARKSANPDAYVRWALVTAPCYSAIMAGAQDEEEGFFDRGVVVGAR